MWQLFGTATRSILKTEHTTLELILHAVPFGAAVEILIGTGGLISTVISIVLDREASIEMRVSSLCFSPVFVGMYDSR